MREIIVKLIKENVPVQNVWVTVDSVDWDNLTMDCTGISDDLEYYDVLLGIGSVSHKPTKETKCLIGTIDNKEALSFLIWCEQFDECLIEDSKGFKWHLKEGELTINGDGFGGLIKIEELVKKMNRLEDKLNSLITKHNSHIHLTTGTVSASPVPGVISPTVATETPIVPNTIKADLENTKIKHGG